VSVMTAESATPVGEDPVQIALRQWSPKGFDPDDLTVAGAVSRARGIVDAARPKTTKEARQAVRCLFVFLMWVESQDYPADADLFADDVIDKYLSESFRPEGTRNFHRSFLRRCRPTAGGGGLAARGRHGAAADVADTAPDAASAAAVPMRRPRRQVRVEDPPGVVAAAIAAFTPARIAADRWDAVAATVRELVGASEPKTAEQARARLGITALLAAWAHHHGLALQAESLLCDGTIEDFLAAAGWADQTRDVYRSLLDSVRRGPPTPTDHTAADLGSTAPYSHDEVTWFLRAAGYAHTTKRRRPLRSLILLGAGAGLTAPADLIRLTPTAIRRDTDNILVVETGTRSVPVLARYATQIEQHAQACIAAGDERLIGGNTASDSRVSDLAHTFERHGRPLEPRRLRLRWLTDVLSGPVHLPALLDAAGLIQPDSLARALPYVADPDPSEARRLLTRADLKR